MAVPNTDDFTLINVKTEIEANGGSNVNSLQAAFDESNSSSFDQQYVGNKDSLYSFRNYAHIVDDSWKLTDMTPITLGAVNC